jgi:hypothetical protein
MEALARDVVAPYQAIGRPTVYVVHGPRDAGHPTFGRLVCELDRECRLYDHNEGPIDWLSVHHQVLATASARPSPQMPCAH